MLVCSYCTLQFVIKERSRKRFIAGSDSAITINFSSAFALLIVSEEFDVYGSRRAADRQGNLLDKYTVLYALRSAAQRQNNVNWTTFTFWSGIDFVYAQIFHKWKKKRFATWYIYNAKVAKVKRHDDLHTHTHIHRCNIEIDKLTNYLF